MGHVVRGWLGIKIQDISPKLAESFGLSSTDGVIIANIVVNGPADKAGLDRGDVLTHINNEKVVDFHDTLNRISAQQPGETITLTIVRNGKTISKDAIVAERPQNN
jgi:S1-C subfamily serine protease